MNLSDKLKDIFTTSDKYTVLSLLKALIEEVDKHTPRGIYNYIVRVTNEDNGSEVGFSFLSTKKRTVNSVSSLVNAMNDMSLVDVELPASGCLVTTEGGPCIATHVIAEPNEITFRGMNGSGTVDYMVLEDGSDNTLSVVIQELQGE